MHMDYQALVRDDRVHGSLYVEPGVFRDEMIRIFHHGWSFIAHASEVPEPGCWITRRVGVERYILTRDLQGRLHALANRCSHRGTALCWEERGRSKTFQCTYHGWSFALDGRLTGVAYRGGLNKDMEELGLDRAGQVAEYRGFVFVNPSGTAGPLSAHLGDGGTELIDRLCDLSPEGSIHVHPTWIGHHIESNWKMWPEADNDGYHFQFVHGSTVQAAPDTYYQETVLGGESGNVSNAVDHGLGHFELDLRPSYKTPIAWLGTTVEKVPDYREALEAAYGAERAGQLMMDGPPHAMIFPNLFLGELNLAIVEPVAPGITVHHHTAVQLDGVDARINRRILRQSEAALGPGSFIVSDDAVTAEKMQSGFGGADPGGLAAQGKAWIDLSRGMARETTDGPRRVGQVTDETTNRAFWRHYRDVMGAAS